MRASYASGFRAPSLKELHLAFLDPQHNVRGNENLKAETGHNFQVSFTRTQKLFKSYTLTVEPVLFYNSISNMIELVRLSSNNIAAQYNNISHFKNACLNLNVGLNSNTVNMQVGYALSAIHNSIMASTNNDYFYNNEFRYNASYTFTKAKTSVSLFYKYNGQIQYYQYNLNENSLNLGYIADFSLLDLTINKYLSNNKLNFTIGVKNLFNTTNVQSNLINTPHASGSANGAIIAMGRTAFINLKYNLDFVMKGKDKK
jgi:outer membrane receptor for ferrienterochelin and colicins